MRLAFSDVGRSKTCFEVDARSFDDPKIMRAVRKHLMSSDVEVLAPRDEMSHGVVVVGGMRTVGTFRVIENEEKRATLTAADRAQATDASERG